MSGCRLCIAEDQIAEDLGVLEDRYVKPYFGKRKRGD